MSFEQYAYDSYEKKIKEFSTSELKGLIKTLNRRMELIGCSARPLTQSGAKEELISKIMGAERVLLLGSVQAEAETGGVGDACDDGEVSLGDSEEEDDDASKAASEVEDDHSEELSESSDDISLASSSVASEQVVPAAKTRSAQSHSRVSNEPPSAQLHTTAAL